MGLREDIVGRDAVRWAQKSTAHRSGVMGRSVISGWPPHRDARQLSQVKGLDAPVTGRSTAHCPLPTAHCPLPTTAHSVLLCLLWPHSFAHVAGDAVVRNEDTKTSG